MDSAVTGARELESLVERGRKREREKERGGEGGGDGVDGEKREKGRDARRKRETGCAR